MKNKSGLGRQFKLGAGSAAVFAILVFAFVGVPGLAYAQIQFGPVGDGANSSSSDTYDRDFVRDWEANPPKGYATLSKANVDATKKAIEKYSEIVSRGGWSTVLPEPQGKNGRDGLLMAGVTDPNVKLLRARLLASGELSQGDANAAYFDLPLEEALKRFQAANGLAPTGMADKRTVAALNVPADTRLKQLKVNLTRLQDFVLQTSKRYVLVNIPAAQIEAVQGGAIYARYAGVVGKAERPTPLLKSTISDLNFNPVWRLPPTVISEDLIPRGREMQGQGKNVLVKFSIDAYDGSGKKVDPAGINWENVKPGTYSYRQQPGKENPLGFLKINFDSAHSVYMHDTPSDRIFGRNFRSESSGCIRVHNIDNLAAWLLADQKPWTPELIAAKKESGDRIDVRLKRPVPLLFVYISAWATPDGVVQFRRDVYQKDGVGELASAY